MSTAPAAEHRALDGTLLPGEVAVASGMVWAAPVRRRVPVLFSGRRRYRLVVSDQRLLVLPRARVRKHARRAPAYVRPFDELRVTRVHPARPMLQLVLVDRDDNRVVLEFRAWERSLAHRVTAAIRAAEHG